jgi:hypothetical protein
MLNSFCFFQDGLSYRFMRRLEELGMQADVFKERVRAHCRMEERNAEWDAWIQQTESGPDFDRTSSWRSSDDYRASLY